MKKTIIYLLATCTLAVIYNETNAQAYRTATAEALENNGKEWVEKKLPSSVITFSEYTGQVEIKTIVAPLTTQQEDTLENPEIELADFTMTIDKDQLPEQLASAKNFTNSGMLSINNISKKIIAQYSLQPRGSADGFTISVIIRFNPSDFNLKMKDEMLNGPLIVKVNSGYLNKQSNNF